MEVTLIKENAPLYLDVYCYICERRVALSNAHQYDGRYFCTKHYEQKEGYCPGGRALMTTVTVKIAVAVDHKGQWSAIGWDSTSDDHSEVLMDNVVENLEEGEARYWVEAELEIPEKSEPKEIKVSKIEQEEGK